jgi:crotonobetainyl-CoA:carnitine CoA-transferase CaiB-like acyl-CoA transferase
LINCANVRFRHSGNRPQLTAILDEVFAARPMSHWYEAFNSVHVPFGAVSGPQEVIDDPQVRSNEIIVPVEGAGGRLTSTISSPFQMRGVAKTPAKRAPKLGEHNAEILEELKFNVREIEKLRESGAVPQLAAG